MGTQRGSDGAAGLAAVLFDMDGTLVETEELWGDALSELAGQLGGRMSASARERTVGTSMRFAMSVLYEDLGVRRTEQDYVDDARWIEDRVCELMAGPTTWRPGARELLLEVVEAALPTALVTTTPRRVAAVVLAQIAGDLGSDPFSLTLCGDEVPARKPDPAPYQQAMAALGVPPAGCVALEDSVVGVTSALAAGAAVLGVPSLQELAPLPGLTLRESLHGVGLPDLAALVADREQDDPAA